MKFIALLVAVLTLTLASAAPAAAARASRTTTTRPVPQVKKILIISIDGLRPDVLLRADAPRIRGMMQDGSFTMWARSTPVSYTLPTHVSLLTGVAPESHSIVWNTVLPLSEPVHPRYPTLFELAHKAGFSTACITGKMKFDIVNKPGTIDHTFFPDETKTNPKDVLAKALQVLREHQPDVMLVHLPDVDVVGHASGWGTRPQLATISNVDKSVGALLDALAELKLTDSTIVMLTSDHGGAGRNHGPDDFRSRHIPWIVTGPGIRKDHDLTNNRGLIVEIYDTFSTACALLGIRIEREVAGKFVADVLEERELLEKTADSR